MVDPARPGPTACPGPLLGTGRARMWTRPPGSACVKGYVRRCARMPAWARTAAGRSSLLRHVKRSVSTAARLGVCACCVHAKPSSPLLSMMRELQQYRGCALQQSLCLQDCLPQQGGQCSACGSHSGGGGLGRPAPDCERGSKAATRRQYSRSSTAGISGRHAGHQHEASVTSCVLPQEMQAPILWCPQAFLQMVKVLECRDTLNQHS